MIREKLLVFGVLMIAVAGSNGYAIAQQNNTMRWAGVIDANATRLRIEIEMVENGGQWSGVARSVDQNDVTFKLANIVLNSEKFSFSLPRPGASFAGKFSEDKQSVVGMFQQGSGETPLTLTLQPSDDNLKTSQVATLKERLDELGEMVDWYVEKDHVVGAELHVIENGRTIFHESFGLVDRNEARPWKNHTICNIRSMTKPITSAAAQLLIERNLLDLDTAVSEYLPSFATEKSKSITVRQVLTHRSGLPLTHLVGPYQFSSLKEQVDAAAATGPTYEPGSKFWYSDTGTDVVGRLVEKVSGEPLHEFVHRELFQPLGMTNTFYGIDADDTRFAEVASLHIKGGAGWFRFWIPRKPLYPFAWGSQTVYSTTSDYAKFLQMLMKGGKIQGRRLLSEAAVERMLEPVSKMKMLGSDANYPTGFRGLETYYGQMMVTHRPINDRDADAVIIGHSGSDGTNAWAWPEKDLVVLYFTQSRGGMTALKIEKPIDRLLIHPGEPIQDGPIPVHLQPYVGEFIANYDGFDNETFTVFVREGKLVLDVPSQMEFELQDPDEDGKWAFAIAPEKIQASFEVEADGTIRGLRLHKAGKTYQVPRKDLPGVPGQPNPKTMHKQGK